MRRLTLLSALVAGAIAAGCSTTRAPSNVDPTLSQLSSSARAAFERGNLNQAASFYERALDRARLMDDGPEIARNGYNLAACYLGLGRPAEARSVLDEARIEFERHGMNQHAVLLLDWKAARAQGGTAEADALFPAVLAAADSGDKRRETWLLKGRYACEDGNKEALKQALDASKSVSGDSQAMKAEWISLSACLASLNAEPRQAASKHDEAADSYRLAGKHRDMAKSLGRAGDAFTAANLDCDATDRFFRAARSFRAQGDRIEALKNIDRGLGSAQRCGDESLKQQLRRLFDEIEREMQPGAAAAAIEP